MPKAAIVMGSKSDLEVCRPAAEAMKSLGIEVEMRVISAHRTPVEAHEFALGARDRGIEVIIAAAGKAA
ncbi:MAG: AIR carboxylase family protein, partial [Christensenellales bacterium]